MIVELLKMIAFSVVGGLLAVVLLQGILRIWEIFHD